MRKITSIPCFLILLLQVSCTAGMPVSMSSPQPLPTWVVTETAAPTALPRATETPQPSPTQTALPSSTLTPPVAPDAWVQTRCFVDASSMSERIPSSGTLVLEKLEPGSTNFFFMNMATGELKQIDQPSERQLYHQISLDHQFLAYESGTIDSEGKVTQWELVVTNAAGERLIAFPEENRWSIQAWATENRLVLWDSSKPNPMNLKPQLRAHF